MPDAHTSTPRVKGRFAPSPSGRMHAGNIYAALVAWLIAKSQGGTIVLRIEDLDTSRCKQEYADCLMRDLEAFGLTWDEGPYYQSKRQDAYREAFEVLQQNAHIYPCFCTRASIAAASAPHPGEQMIYAGTCRNLSTQEQEEHEQEIQKQGRAPSWRIEVSHDTISFHDLLQGQKSYELAHDCGDFVVKRSDGGFSYQLAVVVDDAAQQVNQVVRGCDLLTSTPMQIYLQELLGLCRPAYAHIPLLMASDGHRLSKRQKDASYDELLARFKSPQRILGHIAYISGLIDSDTAITAEELLQVAHIESLKGTTAIQW